ncbi:MAG: hypothetical protein HC941_23690 [Microcoleus sp. SU_5_3]|nr:hypothetical protein [Microcoleus sp. SU_5_3]
MWQVWRALGWGRFIDILVRNIRFWRTSPYRLGRYCIVELLGRGGFGKTYLAEDIDKLNERCVVKQLAPKVQERGNYSVNCRSASGNRNAADLSSKYTGFRLTGALLSKC